MVKYINNKLYILLMEDPDEYSLLPQKQDNYSINMSRKSIFLLCAAIIGGILIFILLIIIANQKS